MTTPTTLSSRRTATRPASEVRRRRVSSGSGVLSAQVTTSELMTLFTGACERSWPIAWSRFSRVTSPTSRSSSSTRIPLWRWRWHSTIACETVSSGATKRAGRDMISAAVGSGRAAPGSASRTSFRASASVPRWTAEAACGCPPPPSAPATAAASSSGTRARLTQKTRPSISTRQTSAWASVRSTILCARLETPSTYVGQATGATSTSSPPTEWLSSAATSASSSARSSSASGARRYCATMSWRAPWRRHHASASASRSATPGIAERARVLVDAEGEDGGLERRHLELALGEDPDHRRRQRAVVGEHEVLGLDPVRRLAGVVVEDDDLDLGVAGDALELAEALRLHRLDDDQPADGVEVDAPGLRDLELVRVQAVELAHVAVERAGERDDRARIEPPRGEHGRERVEVRVRVGDDDVHGWKVRPGRAVSPFLRMRTVQLGTHGERGVLPPKCLRNSAQLSPRSWRSRSSSRCPRAARSSRRS